MKDRGIKLMISYAGVTQSRKHWEKQLGFGSGTLTNRLARGWSLERAMTEKPMSFRQAGMASAQARGCMGALCNNPQDRFWLFCPKLPDDECWEWTSTRTKRGYGCLNYRNDDGHRSIYAHRLSWEIHNGPIPNSLHVLHRCDNPPCVNPKHLFLGTHGDNMRDMFAKGRRTHLERMPRGSNNHLAIVSESDVRQIRELRAQGLSLRNIAAMFPVTEGAIWRIVKRITWKHLP